MLDVHSPHAATHTWKDFWIHLGTIAAGLLLAIGLEQSVEALHRVHQRHILMDELRAETSYNNGILESNIRALSGKVAFYTALLSRVPAADNPEGSPQLPPMPKEPAGNSFLTSSGAWDAARDSNELGLLPRNIVSVYEELYQQRELATSHVMIQWLDAEDDLDHFWEKHGETKRDPTLLSPVDRAECNRLLDHALSMTEVAEGTTEFYLAENKAVLDGVSSTNDLHRAVLRSMQVN